MYEIVIALGEGAYLVLKSALGKAGEQAYKKLRDWISERIGRRPVDQLTATPESDQARAEVSRLLQAEVTTPDQIQALSLLAEQLRAAIRRAEGDNPTVGMLLREYKGKRAHFDEILAAPGTTGVDATGAEIDELVVGRVETGGTSEGKP